MPAVSAPIWLRSAPRVTAGAVLTRQQIEPGPGKLY